MNHRRTGKIARLPEEIRNELNEMLDDGVEYQRIIDWLAGKGFPGFKHNNISRWKDGGFEDWLHYHARLDELELKMKWAAQVAQDTNKNELHQASLGLTGLQFFEMLNRFEPTALSRLLHSHPEKYPTLINSLARYTREMVGLQKFRCDQAEKARQEEKGKRTDKGGLTAEGRKRVREELRLIHDDESKTGNRPDESRTNAGNQPV